MARKSEENGKTVSAEITDVKEEKFMFATFLYDWAGTLLIAFAVLLLAMAFFCRQITVNGDSMNNTLQNKDRLLVLSFMYTPRCGDIVVCTHGENLDEPIIKRVIAVEGQHLEIDYMNDKVIVDGKVLDEDYIKGMTIRLPNSTRIPDVIPEGYVFVMGDNRENSLDSRSRKVGLIPVENIIGKAVYRIYPFEKFGEVG
ncbi:MAG: signal peptidase I [Clostridia bacterium]|nr:signal peptidase I [Clostridia bacterium]